MKKIIVILIGLIILISGFIHISIYRNINSSYSIDGDLPKQIEANRKQYVNIDEIPENFKKALITVEDKRFYKHIGFDPISIARAFYVNVKEGKVKQGGSTITQQLVKNLFLTNERSMDRKVKEFFLAVDLESRYTKDEILEMYVNAVYYGSNVYGLGEASRAYFNKKPSELSLGECAMLAGIVQAPSIYNPKTNFEKAKERQRIVLKVMNNNGVLDKKYNASADIIVVAQ